MGEVFEQVLSIGQRCRSRYQIDRIFGKYTGRRSVFDWQVTPPAALLEYLARDFEGMFERPDLVVHEREVLNARFRTGHPHQFPKGIRNEEIDRYYPKARKSHDQWCDTARRAIKSDLSTLFILCFPVTPDFLNEISAAIGRHKIGRFHVLNGPENDTDSKADWEGDSSIWDRHLSSIEFRPPQVAKARYYAHTLSRRMQQAFIPKPWRR